MLRIQQSVIRNQELVKRPVPSCYFLVSKVTERSA